MIDHAEWFRTVERPGREDAQAVIDLAAERRNRLRSKHAVTVLYNQLYTEDHCGGGGEEVDCD